MRVLTVLIFAYLFSSSNAYAQSKLLESVKRNPVEAKALCQKFKQKNTMGISYRSKKVIEEISKEKNLSFTDAEILSVYVIGMYCPKVK